MRPRQRIGISQSGFGGSSSDSGALPDSIAWRADRRARHVVRRLLAGVHLVVHVVVPWRSADDDSAWIGRIGESKKRCNRREQRRVGSPLWNIVDFGVEQVGGPSRSGRPHADGHDYGQDSTVRYVGRGRTGLLRGIKRRIPIEADNRRSASALRRAEERPIQPSDGCSAICCPLGMDVDCRARRRHRTDIERQCADGVCFRGGQRR